jgi:hypothetical protein
MGVGPGLRDRIEQHIELFGSVSGDDCELIMGGLSDLAETVADLLRSGCGSLKECNRAGENWRHRIEQIGDHRAPRNALQGCHASDDLKRGLFKRHSDTWFCSWHVVPLVYTFGGSVPARCTLWQ